MDPDLGRYPEIWAAADTRKKLGEQAEAVFLSKATGLGLAVLKPWGDSERYDLVVGSGKRLLRVQVKSTSFRKGNGYLCGFSSSQKNNGYTRGQVDFFAAYVIPKDVWYIIPAAAVLKRKGTELMLYPVQAARRDRYKYEVYREAWKLLRSGTKGHKAPQSPVILRPPGTPDERPVRPRRSRSSG